MPKLCSKCGKQLYKNGNCRGCSQRGKPCPQRTFVATREWIELHRKANFGNKKALGIKHSVETRLRYSLLRKGKHLHRPTGILHTANWKNKCSEWMRGNKNGLSGKHRDTKIELRVKSFLLSIGIPFEAQKHFPKIGSTDFFVPMATLVIECDGDYWHNRPGSKEKDQKRDRALTACGNKILRLTETQINHNFDFCAQQIYSCVFKGGHFGTRKGLL